MIRVAVVDDEPLARRGVIARLRSEADVSVVHECTDGAGLARLRRADVDLVIVDVQMPGLSGLEALESIPRSERPLAILLTAHDSFAVQAFGLEAIDYLLKPIDDERFAESIDRARRHLGRPPGISLMTRFSVRVGMKLSIVPVDDVESIEADGDYVVLHARGERHLLREKLHVLSTRLDPARFLRVHRSAIVRVDQVVEVRPRPNRDALLRLRDGTTLRASRTYADAWVAAWQVNPAAPKHPAAT